MNISCIIDSTSDLDNVEVEVLYSAHYRMQSERFPFSIGVDKRLQLLIPCKEVDLNEEIVIRLYHYGDLVKTIKPKSVGAYDYGKEIPAEGKYTSGECTLVEAFFEIGKGDVYGTL